MVLLNDVVEVTTAPHVHVFPLWILPSQRPQRSMARCVASSVTLRGHRGRLVASALFSDPYGTLRVRALGCHLTRSSPRNSLGGSGRRVSDYCALPASHR